MYYSYNLEEKTNRCLERNNERIKQLITTFNSLNNTNLTFTTHIVNPSKYPSAT